MSGLVAIVLATQVRAVDVVPGSAKLVAHWPLREDARDVVGTLYGQQPHKDVLLPKFQTRLATLRTDIQRQQTERIVERIKHAKLR